MLLILPTNPIHVGWCMHRLESFMEVAVLRAEKQHSTLRTGALVLQPASAAARLDARQSRCHAQELLL